ncbi:MAG TPA: polyprenyl synthetase family protein [Phycisphaerae bacterium]|nr:polyprenyl synthetase family protein [Phycisphaerae bacterium]HRW54548.1 polyprenyl synthetase family protein [Phycisphaerae bacterium]
MAEALDKSIADVLVAEGAGVSAELAAAIDAVSGIVRPEKLLEAMRYSLLSGGKRLRPALALWSCEACGETRETAMGAAVAIECVHAFSLIHDDLPALDNDDTRRGRPTNHVVFGESTAILAGDALLALAFETLSKAYGATRAIGPMVSELANATGAAGMIGGEWLDLDAEGKALDGDDVKRIHLGKTARLIQCACRLGGLAASADQKHMAALSGYGKALGLAFQIVDDLLDVTGDPNAVGKRTGKDADRGKATYPSAVGIDASREMAALLVDGALRHIEPLGEGAERLRRLATYVIDRTH